VTHFPRLPRVLSALQHYFAGVDVSQLIDFEFVFPTAASSLDLHEYLLIPLICDLLDEEFDLELIFGLRNALKRTLICRFKLKHCHDARIRFCHVYERESRPSFIQRRNGPLSSIA
jgi:hypothetical protein